MVKSAHRFDYNRFAETLAARGLIEHETLNHVLQQVSATGSLLTEVLVVEGFVSDWEVARVCCELYHLPFLTVDNYPAAKTAMEGIDPEYLRQFAIVPLDRFGELLTVSMPGLVPSEALDGLLTTDRTRILPVVGSVLGNRRWLEEHLPPSPMMGVPSALPASGTDESWAGIFDAGDQAVQLELLGSPDDEDDGIHLDLADEEVLSTSPKLELRLKGESDDE